MMRFYYKADVQQKAKILRKVPGCLMGGRAPWPALWPLPHKPCTTTLPHHPPPPPRPAGHLPPHV